MACLRPKDLPGLVISDVYLGTVVDDIRAFLGGKDWGVSTRFIEPCGAVPSPRECETTYDTVSEPNGRSCWLVLSDGR